MKRIIISLLILIPAVLSAQTEKANDRPKFNGTFNVDFCTSLNGTFTENEFDDLTLKLNRLRLDLKGKLSDQFSFRVRQSFNKSFSKNAVENVPAALEYANIQWHPNPNFKLTTGKQFLAIAGYEALANSMYVREFSDFNNNLAFYRLGITGAVKLDQERNHELQIQVANNSDFSSVKMPFITSVCWNGFVADRALNLVYAASVAPITKDRNLYYLSCGNIYEKGPIFAYLDVMYSREEIDTQGRLTAIQNGMTAPMQNVEYLSFIAKFEYFFNSKWNAYVKGAYETSGVYEANSVFAKGRYMTNWNGQVSVEWKPFEKDKGFKLFAHYLYKGYTLEGPAKNLLAIQPDTQRISIGAIYAIPVF